MMKAGGGGTMGVSSVIGVVVTSAGSGYTTNPVVSINTGNSLSGGSSGIWMGNSGGGGGVGVHSVGSSIRPQIRLKEPETLAELVDMGINGPKYVMGDAGLINIEPLLGQFMAQQPGTITPGGWTQVDAPVDTSLKSLAKEVWSIIRGK